MAHIETLIQFHKTEAAQLGIKQPLSQIFWTTFRIMDYFYKKTMDGSLHDSLIYYCKLLEGSSVLEKYDGSIAKMIEDFKKHEQPLIDTAMSLLNEHDMEFSLNPGSVITILQMCNYGGKMFSWGGRKKSRYRRRHKRKSKTI